MTEKFGRMATPLAIIGAKKFWGFAQNRTEIEKLVNGNLSSGRYNIKFNASNYSSGVYFYKIEASGLSKTNKMIIIK